MNYNVLYLCTVVAYLVTDCNGSTTCGQNQVSFLEKCWCKPGFDPFPTNNDHLNCNVTVINIGPCSCEPDKPFDRSFLTNNSWVYTGKSGGNNGESVIRCTNLCKSNNQIGVPYSIPNEWKDNQHWKQIGFYKKELTIASEKRRHNHLIERLDEFGQGYSEWQFLNNVSLGSVIEFGAGGYTQTRNIMERTRGVHIHNVTLVDPMIFEYKKIRSCSYESGSLSINGTMYPTELSDLTVEEWGKRRVGSQFDTVISMNVLVYAKDAFKFLQTLYDSLKPGGLLLFHDRWFDDPSRSSRCKMSGFMTNILQVKRPLLDHFLQIFDFQGIGTYYNTNQTDRAAYRSKNWCPNDDNEVAYFVAGRRKTNNPAKDVRRRA